MIIYETLMNMKNLILFLVLFVLPLGVAHSEEITLFDSEGKPIAYIDTTDDDLTIYMWNGKPVAYLILSNDDCFHIYGFNGKHLGWFSDGLIMNHDGDVVGFNKGTVNMYTKYEPYKSYKQYKPYKSYKQYAPYKPLCKNRWSGESLSLFLLRDRND